MSTRERLIACALDELEQGGLEAFSLRSVSAAAGVTPMAVYRHFPSKDELLQAAGRAAFEEWKRRVDSVRTEDPIEWLRQAGRQYLQFALDAPALFDACFVLRTGVERRYPRDFRDGKSPVVSMLLECVATAQAAGRLAPGDPLEFAMFFWAQLHGLAMLQRSGRFAMSRNAFLALGARTSNYALGGVGLDTSEAAA
jgi:AcrR family transcriptional regulator